MRQWFSGGSAPRVGYELADQITASMSAPLTALDSHYEKLFELAERKARNIKLNLYTKARLANSFKWRLLESGMDQVVAEQMTNALVMHLSRRTSMSGALERGSRNPDRAVDTHTLLQRGKRRLAEGAYQDAVGIYREVLDLGVVRANVFNDLAVALSRVGQFAEAEQRLRQAIDLEPEMPEAHCNLGNILRWRGDLQAAEPCLRRALKLKPNYVEALISLAFVLALTGRLPEAKRRFEKVLKRAPAQADAMFGLGQIAHFEGRFEDAERWFDMALKASPNMVNAWSALVRLKKMGADDQGWLEKAEQLAAKGLEPLAEANIRFAIGKYHDDVSDFESAFDNFKRANELLTMVAVPYNRSERERLVRDLVRSHTRRSMANAVDDGSNSELPVFVVGMMRSGTSLAEQILASHPNIQGVGELEFWNNAVRKYQDEVRRAPLPATVRTQLADEYLGLLMERAAGARRVIDKTTLNSDYMGIIHTVFPKARFILMQRDPIDTCLSCYFQQFRAALNFTMDLSNLAHYYHEHRRLEKHWLETLPPDSILKVPYADLVEQPEAWMRRMTEFLGLEWNGSLLSFHDTKRAVLTASAWHVRQRIYKDSVGRWRNYERHIGPLRKLR